MSCTKCGTSNTACGCKDTPYTTALQQNCQPDSTCPTPSKCSEYMDASCVYLNDGIYDADLPARTSLEKAIQQLTLMITNPLCTNTSSCNCPTPFSEGLPAYADDAAAAAGGVAINGLYRTGSVIKIRVS